MNNLETAVRESILEKIVDFNLFFNKVEVGVHENKRCGSIDMNFKIEINCSKGVSLKELWKAEYDVLEFITKDACRSIQDVLFEELGNNLKKDKDGLKIIVSDSIPKDIVLCNPYTALRIRLLNQLLEYGHPSFHEEFSKLLLEGVNCETYI